MNRPQNTISQWLRSTSIRADNNESAPPDNRQKLDDEDRQAILEMVGQGQTQKAVAEHFGVSASTVSAIVRASHATESISEWLRTNIIPGYKAESSPPDNRRRLTES